jgi:hypothetical protein
MGELVDGLRGRLSVETAAGAMGDHAGRPASICRHLDSNLNPLEAIQTLGSALIDMSTSTLHLAFGSPCETTYEPIVPAFARRGYLSNSGSRGPGVGERALA